MNWCQVLIDYRSARVPTKRLSVPAMPRQNVSQVSRLCTSDFKPTVPNVNSSSFSWTLVAMGVGLGVRYLHYSFRRDANSGRVFSCTCSSLLKTSLRLIVAAQEFLCEVSFQPSRECKMP